MKILFKTAALFSLVFCLITAPSDATSLDYSYTFTSGLVVSGSLDGTVNGEFVDNVSNVNVFFNGVAMPGTVFTAKYTGSWVSGPIVSFDVFKTNLMFVNSDYVHGDSSYNSVFQILNRSVYIDTAKAQSVPLGIDQDNSPTEQARWSLTPANVPDGA